MTRVALLIAIGLWVFALQSPAAAQTLAIPPKGVVFPAADVACRHIVLPVPRADATPLELQANEELVAKTIEAERGKWIDAAKDSTVKAAGPIFLETDLPPEGASEVKGKMCAVVPDSAKVEGLSVEKRQARTGYIGYCATDDPEVCLLAVSAALGFTEEKPWPRLPIYSLWEDDLPSPASDAQVLSYLVATSQNYADPPSGKGKTVEVQIDQDPVKACEPDGCPTQPEAVIKPGKGLAWFIALNESELPATVRSDTE